MSKIYITFDNYYDVTAYNSFLTASKNNNIEFEEYIKIRAPFDRFIRLNSKADLPSFVNYDFATSSDIQWLVSTVKPVQPDEEYMLRRREGKDISYWNYIIPEPLREAHNEDYIMVFKAWDMTELNNWSKKLGKTKIYKWGKAKIKGYKIYICFNPYIKGLIPEDRVLMEFGDDASSGLKHSTNVPNTKGDLEYYLNKFVLVKEKLENKTYKLEYHSDGKKVPLKRNTFI